MTAAALGAPVDQSGSSGAATPPRFRRVKRGQWWSYELGGRRLPSVTKLIGDGVPKPHLIDWSAGVAAEYAFDHIDTIAQMDRDGAIRAIAGAHNVRRKTTATKGSDVHRIAQALNLGEAVDVPEAIGGYVDGYLAFLNDWQPNTIAVEAGIVSRRWCYAGTFDVLMDLPGIATSDPAIVDVKTGGKGVWPETCLQIAAYRHADAYVGADGVEHPMPATSGGYALALSDDGTYELLPVESGPDQFAVFLHVAHVAAWCDRKREDLIGLPLASPEAIPA